MVHLSALRYFREVARSRSIRQAAERLRVAPSAISRQIQNLEHGLGAPLIERRSSGIRLTVAGEILLRHTSGIVRDLERVHALIDDLRGLRQGSVSVWSVEGVVSDFLAPVIADFNQTYPAIVFKVVATGTPHIIEAVNKGEADVGITFNAAERPDVYAIAVRPVPQRAIMSPSHPLAARTSVTLKDISSFPVALPDSQFGVRQLIDRAASASGVALSPVVESTSFEMLKGIVRSGHAVTFLPLLCVARECEAGYLTSVVIDDRLLAAGTTEICVQRDNQGSFAVNAFTKVLKTALLSWPLEEKGVGAAHLSVAESATRRRQN